MKRLTLIGFIAMSTIAMLAFQNCSQTQYESSSELEAAVSDINAGKPANENDFIRICPMVMCAAPPLGCRYEQDASTNQNNQKSFCSSSCGRLVCDRLPPIEELPPIDEPIQCEVAVRCQAPAEGCRMEGVEFDRRGCQIGCGHQVCPRLPPIEEQPVEPTFPIGVKPPVACPMIMCAQEEGCRLAGQPTLDKNGCATDCGVQVCDTRIRPPVKKCHAMGIACLDVMPGPNCTVDDSKTTDENGCPVACPVYKCAEEM